MSFDKVMSALDEIDVKLQKNKSLTETELKNIGEAQRDLANRLLKLETRSGKAPEVDWGTKAVDAPAYKNFIDGKSKSATIEVKNTITNAVGATFSERKPDVVPGAFAPLAVESLFNQMPATSNSISFVRENVFTNSAAEATEGAAAAESSITFTEVQESVRDVSHWVKISRQLAEDSAALAAYINTRLIYGVNRRVEQQLVVGNGTAPNLSGIFKSGNYTNHGYTNADLGSTLKKFVLIRKVIADLTAAGYPPTAILLNPTDWCAIEIDMLANNPTIASVADLNNGIPQRLFGVPVVPSNGVAVDTFAVGKFDLAGTLYDRSNVTIDMSYSDLDNFTKQLVTVFASRRLALAIESPAAIRAGDLTPV